MENKAPLRSIKSAKGFGLLEMILVFILVISASAVVANMFLSARPTVQASNASKNLATIRSNLQAIWGVHNSYVGVTTGKAISSHAIPESMVSGTTVYSLWDSEIKIKPGDATNEVDITYIGVPGGNCVKFVTSAAPFFKDISIGAAGGSVFSNNQLDPTKVVDKCTPGPVDITFTAV